MHHLKYLFLVALLALTAPPLIGSSVASNHDAPGVRGDN